MFSGHTTSDVALRLTSRSSMTHIRASRMTHGRQAKPKA
jgi:hypothetical protein